MDDTNTNTTMSHAAITTAHPQPHEPLLVGCTVSGMMMRRGRCGRGRRRGSETARRQTATTPTTDNTPPISSLTSNACGVDGGWDDDERGRRGRGR